MIARNIFTGCTRCIEWCKRNYIWTIFLQCSETVGEFQPQTGDIRYFDKSNPPPPKKNRKIMHHQTKKDYTWYNKNTKPFPQRFVEF